MCLSPTDLCLEVPARGDDDDDDDDTAPTKSKPRFSYFSKCRMVELFCRVKGAVWRLMNVVRGKMEYALFQEMKFTTQLE